MERTEILTRLKEIVCEERNEQLDFNENTLLKDRIENRESLGLSSMELISIIIKVEDCMDVEISEMEIAKLIDMGNLVNLIMAAKSQQAKENSRLEEIKEELFD